MTEERQKKIKNRLTLLTVSIIFLLAVLLIVLATTKKMDTIWFPLGAGALLALYWVVSDILPVIWLRQFEDKTESQKRSYYIYAVIDAVGLGGLLYFIMSMTSMTGALVYVASVLMKKRYHDEYLGVSPAEPEDGSEEAAESEETSAAVDGESEDMPGAGKLSDEVAGEESEDGSEETAEESETDAEEQMAEGQDSQDQPE